MADDDLIELIAPGGCDEANHGTVRYRVDNDGRIRVPREAAYWLIHRAGFRVVDPDPSPRSAKFARIEPETFADMDFSGKAQPDETTAPQAQSGDGAEATADPRRAKRSK
jgi:hypothetical protein